MAALVAWSATAAAAGGGLDAADGAVPRPAAARGEPRLLELDLRTEAFRLWEQAGFGADRSEHAAWAVAGPAGSGFVAWPWDRRYLSSRWAGPPPAGAIAIVHTHPTVVDPLPSIQDRDTAARLGVAVYTVSRRGIWRAGPDGAVTRVGDERWWDGCGSGKSCRESVGVPFALAAKAPGAPGETGERDLRITE